MAAVTVSRVSRRPSGDATARARRQDRLDERKKKKRSKRVQPAPPAAEPEPESADETAAFLDACRRLPEAAAEALSLLPGAAGGLQAGRPFRPRPAEPSVATPLLAHVLSTATRSLEERASEAFRRRLV
jgi:hypothetical protein